MTTRLPALAVLGALIVALPVTHAQPPESKKGWGQGGPGGLVVPKGARTVYAVKHADPAALAQMLSTHFRGEAVISPTGSGTTLLISGSADATAEVTKLLDQLDRKPRNVEVEVVLAEVKAGKDAAELTGGDGLAKLAELTKAKRVESLQRIRLTAAEGKPVTSTTGGSKPIVSGIVSASGLAQRSVVYRDLATTVKLTARVGADDAVTVDLNVQDSRIREAEPPKDAAPKLPAPREKGTKDAPAKPPEPAAPGAKDGPATVPQPREKKPRDNPFGGFGQPGGRGEGEPRPRPTPPDITPPSFETTTLITSLSVPAGRAVTAQAVRADGATGPTVLLVIVTARVEPTGK